MSRASKLSPSGKLVIYVGDGSRITADKQEIDRGEQDWTSIFAAEATAEPAFPRDHRLDEAAVPGPDRAGNEESIMVLQLGALREALLSAGTPSDRANKAAEEVAGYENRLAPLSVLTWAVTAHIAYIGHDPAEGVPLIRLPPATEPRRPLALAQPMVVPALIPAPSEHPRAGARSMLISSGTIVKATSKMGPSMGRPSIDCLISL